MIQEKEIKYFTNDELKKLFKAIKEVSKHPERDEAIFKVAYYCALRASEVGLLNIDDFNTNKNEIYCRRLKGSNNNTIRIVDSDVLRALKRHIRVKNPEDVIFKSQKGNPISRKMLDLLMKKYCEAAGIKDVSKWHFHTLKHTRAIDLAELGLDLKEIQYWLGHKEISNTQIYYQFTSSQYELLYKKLKSKERY